MRKSAQEIIASCNDPSRDSMFAVFMYRAFLKIVFHLMCLSSLWSLRPLRSLMSFWSFFPFDLSMIPHPWRLPATFAASYDKA